MEPRAEWLLEDARRHDRDRAVAAMLCPERQRPAVLAVIAFNTEIARVRERVTEPTLGHIRLRWWADALDRAAVAEDARSAPLLRTLAELRTWRDLRPRLGALVEARARDLDDPPFADVAAAEEYLAAVTAPLADALALALGRPEFAGDAAVAAAARAHGLVGLLRAAPARLRQGRRLWAADLADAGARAQLGRDAAARANALIAEAAAARLPRAAFPLVAPAALTRQHLALLRRNGYEIFDPRLALPSRVTPGFVLSWWRGRL
jgi:phytoene synthase